MDWSDGVVGCFQRAKPPSGSTTRKSVNVPPTSIPIR
jgi:hypothetical protein